MMRLLSFLWSGCWHVWRTVGSGPYSKNGESVFVKGTYFVLRCEKCGEVKWRKP